ncbi:MAG: enoyl-CoA hydratase/isomerase family protein [Corynebacterium sp.]|nr:enoyl-CoA hydratase/isomerase family protein [Corynebacterium sp.]
MCDTEIRTQIHKQVATIELCRPKALHSLNLAMVEQITTALRSWEHDPTIEAIIIVARGGKGFCAGGDVRQAREFMLTEDPRVEDFFHAEYRMNAYMASYPKPLVALVDGVVMGGGMGLSGHCNYRVISPKTFGAMPEAAIGFCPDVGMTGFYRDTLNDPVLSNFILGLGWHMQASDLRWAGFATHVCADMDALEAEIYEHGLEQALSNLPEIELEESWLATHAAEIQTIGMQSWEQLAPAILQSSFAEQAQRYLEQANPESLVATQMLVEAVAETRGVQASIYAEYLVGKVLRYRPNFVEGVRAVLVDKDKNPNFSPAILDEVSTEFRHEVASALEQVPVQDWLSPRSS